MNPNHSQVVHADDTNFNQLVMQSPLPVLVDFHATWCGPCQMLAPLIDRLAEEYAGRVRFVKVDVDEAPGLAAGFRIQGVPTLLVIDQGKIVDQVVGLAPPAALRRMLDKVAAPATTR
ncbi:MAG: thioredoxin [Verrucomicrobia bacterium]|nr:MAG: thioredoxin [Verrucomicrobiota bacterium]